MGDLGGILVPGWGVGGGGLGEGHGRIWCGSWGRAGWLYSAAVGKSLGSKQLRTAAVGVV